MALKLPAFVDARQLEVKMLPEDLLQLLIENPKSALRPTEEEWKAHFEWMSTVAGFSKEKVQSRAKKPIDERPLGIRLSLFIHFHRAGFPIDLIQPSMFDTEQGWAKKNRKVASFVTKVECPIIEGSAGWWCTPRSVESQLIADSPSEPIIHLYHTFPAEDEDESAELERISFQFFPFQPKRQPSSGSVSSVSSVQGEPEKTQPTALISSTSSSASSSAESSASTSPSSSLTSHSVAAEVLHKPKRKEKKVPKSSEEGPAYLVESVAESRAIDEEIKKLINIRDDLRPTKEEWDAYAEWLTLRSFPKDEIKSLMSKPIWKRNPGVRIALFLHFYRLDIPIEHIISKNIATVNTWKEQGRICWDSAKYVWAPIIKSDPTWWCKKQIIDPNIIDQVPLGRVCHIFQTSTADVSDWREDRALQLSFWREQRALHHQATISSSSSSSSSSHEEIKSSHTPPRFDTDGSAPSSPSLSSPSSSSTPPPSSFSSPAAAITPQSVAKTVPPHSHSHSHPHTTPVLAPSDQQKTLDPKIQELKEQLSKGEIDEEQFYQLVSKIHRKRKRRMEAEKRRRFEEQTQQAIAIQANIVHEMTEVMERYVIARIMAITKAMHIEDQEFVARMLEVNSELANNVEAKHSIPSYPTFVSDPSPSKTNPKEKKKKDLY